MLVARVASGSTYSLYIGSSYIICGAVFAEALACPGADEAFVRSFLAQTGVAVDFEIGEDIWTETGRRYTRYAERRRRNSKPTGNLETKRVLADFIIGSHALLQADCMITLDRGRYHKDFPELRLI
jgi:predicted nucleic acid-binding protein